MFSEPLIKDGMSVGFGRSIFECTWEGGEKVGAAVKESFGALRYELWWGRGGVCEGCGKRRPVRDDRNSIYRW